MRLPSELLELELDQYQFNLLVASEASKDEAKAIEKARSSQSRRG